MTNADLARGSARITAVRATFAPVVPRCLRGLPAEHVPSAVALFVRLRALRSSTYAGLVVGYLYATSEATLRRLARDLGYPRHPDAPQPLPR